MLYDEKTESQRLNLISIFKEEISEQDAMLDIIRSLKSYNKIISNIENKVALSKSEEFMISSARIKRMLIKKFRGTYDITPPSYGYVNYTICDFFIMMEEISFLDKHPTHYYIKKINNFIVRNNKELQSLFIDEYQLIQWWVEEAELPRH